MINDSNQFEKIVQSFYGCTAGNIHSPVWICGLEWGGGFDKSIPIFIDNIEPYDFQSLHVWTAEQFENYFWAPRSAFCRNVIKLLYSLKNGTCSNWSSNMKDWEKDGIAGPNGIAMILNAYPISFKNRDQAYHNWEKFYVRSTDGKTKSLKEWTRLDNFGVYREYVLEKRSQTFINERKLRTPKLIIGLGYENYQKLWGAENHAWENAEIKFKSKPEKSNPDCFGYWLDNGLDKEKTLLLITPFPTGSHGLVSNGQIDMISQQLRSELGDNWLEICLEKMPNSQLDRLSRAGSNPFSTERLHEKISHFNELVNQELTCLEQIEEEIEKLISSRYTLPHSTELVTGDLNKRIIDHFGALKDLAKLAKTIQQTERQQAWQEVKRQLPREKISG